MLRAKGNLDISNLSNVKAYNITINSNNTINIPKLDKQNASGFIEFLSPNSITVNGNCKLSNLVIIAQNHDIDINFGDCDLKTENVYIDCQNIHIRSNVKLPKGQVQVITSNNAESPNFYLGINGNIQITGQCESVKVCGSLDANRRLEEAKLRAARELTQQQNEFYTAKQSA